MVKIRLLASLFCFQSISFSQNIHVGIFGGLAAYQGDLTDKIIPKKVTNGAIGVTVNYELTPQIMLRGGFTYSIIGGADRFATMIRCLRAILLLKPISLNSAPSESIIFSTLTNRSFHPMSSAASPFFILILTHTTERQTRYF